MEAHATKEYDRVRSVVSLNEGAAMLGVSRRTLERLIAAGSVRVIRVSERRLVVSTADLDAYLESQRAGP